MKRSLPLLTCFLLPLLLAGSSLSAQDYRNDMFGSRTAGYEPQNNKRGEMVTEVDPRLRPFYHGVASGDPSTDGAVIWTRVTPENGDVSVALTYKVATDPELQNVIGQGGGLVTAETDFCFKAELTGLQPGTYYYYGFTAYGKNSLTGRTRTLPVGGYDHARFAVVTCANYPAGFFNAYGRIADRNDLDAVLHMGDYIYEYDADTTSYAGGTGAALGRSHEPDAELVQLADYRTRYAQYRTDPDLIRLHQQHPVIHVWDDHESANDSYTDGAENHNPGEGEWSVRKATSLRVHSEWMPVRRGPTDPVYRDFTFGDLVDVAMLDTRLDGRDKQVNGVYEGAPQASLDSLNDPNRKIMSAAQYEWLTNIIQSSAASWRIIGSQVMFTPCESNPIDSAYLWDGLGPILSVLLRPRFGELQTIFDLVYKGDVWNNYPAQRALLAEFIRENKNSRNIVVSGDFHVGMSFDGSWPDGNIGATEFMTPSISAPNFDENIGGDPVLGPLAPIIIGTVDTSLKQNNPQLKWQELNDHGYLILDITRDRAQSDWFFVDTILARSSNESWRIGFSTTGNGSLTLETAPAQGKSEQAAPAPPDPPVSTSVQEERTDNLTVIGFGPNPATNAIYVSFTTRTGGMASIHLVDVKGADQMVAVETQTNAGLNSIVIDLRSVPSGAYQLVLQIEGAQRTIPIIVQH